MEVDEIAVPEAAWEKACKGDPEARIEIARIVSGLVLYFHAFHVPENWTVIKLTDLEKARIYAEVRVTLESCAANESLGVPMECQHQ